MLTSGSYKLNVLDSDLGLGAPRLTLFLWACWFGVMWQPSNFRVHKAHLGCLLEKQGPGLHPGYQDYHHPQAIQTPGDCGKLSLKDVCRARGGAESANANGMKTLYHAGPTAPFRLSALIWGKGDALVLRSALG